MNLDIKKYEIEKFQESSRCDDTNQNNSKYCITPEITRIVTASTSGIFRIITGITPWKYGYTSSDMSVINTGYQSCYV